MREADACEPQPARLAKERGETVRVVDARGRDPEREGADEERGTEDGHDHEGVGSGLHAR